jgi:hypothetical protein
VIEHRAQLEAESAVGGQQRITGCIGVHLSIAQDELGQYGEDRLATCALDAPDGEAAQADPGIMGVTRQAPPPRQLAL